MSPRPTRETVEGRAYLDLQNLARRTDRPTDELHQIYALEGFLDRLAHSGHAKRFVLKGGVLLAAYDARRPTRDIDLSGRAIANETRAIREVVAEVLAAEVDDGLAFDRRAVAAETIRDQDDYGGVRVFVKGRLAAAQLHFHVDVNIADPITPAPKRVAIPRLLGGEIRVVGYPIEMVLAEKIVTAIERGTANTRWRDFVDIATLAARRPPDADRLDRSLRAVARHRLVELIPLADVLDGYADLAQTRWARWRAKHRLEDSTAERFDELLATVIALADPVIAGEDGKREWDPVIQAWS
jgi:hypothetical protein